MVVDVFCCGGSPHAERQRTEPHLTMGRCSNSIGSLSPSSKLKADFCSHERMAMLSRWEIETVLSILPSGMPQSTLWQFLTRSQTEVPELESCEDVLSFS